MKKRFTMLLAALMLLLPACGQGAAEGSAPPPSGASALPAQTDAPSQPVGEPAPGFDPTATLEETVLVDEGDVKITATAITYRDQAVDVGLFIENNTDQKLSFQSGMRNYYCSSVNGYMVDGGYLSADVAAGKKANETLSFNIDELSLMGITDIADIELCFYICDEDRNDYLETGPCQLKTSIADHYDYGTDTYREVINNHEVLNSLGLSVTYDSEQDAFDQGGVRVVSQTLATNSNGELALLIELENSSGAIVRAVTSNVAINGLEFQDGTWFTDAIAPGKRRVSLLNLSSELNECYQEIFGISEVGQITYTLEIKNDDYDTIGSPQALTVSVPDVSSSHNSTGEELYQGDGLRIVSKGLVTDPHELSDDIYLLLLVENGSSEELCFDIADDSLSVNGYMTDFLCFGNWVAPGNSAVLTVELNKSSLAESGIADLGDITEIELAFEIRDDGYNMVVEPAIKFNN